MAVHEKNLSFAEEQRLKIAESVKNTTSLSENVIPEKTRLKADIDLSTTDEIGTIQAMEKLSVANTIIVRKTGRSINFQFLSDLAEMKWKLYAGSSKTQPVVFRKVNQEETVFAVLAPLSA